MVQSHQTNQIQLTAEGLKAFREELNQLKNVRRPQVVDRLSAAREKGDLSENSDYTSAKEELSFIDGRITELEILLSQAVVTTSNDNNNVQIGHQVTLKIMDKNEEHIFQVVGEWEADPKQKKISHESPLGKALIGKKVGEVVEVEAPAGKVKYTIVKISC